MKTNDINDVFCTLLCDVNDAQKQLKDALPKMSENTKSAELSAALQKHARKTEEQLERLQKVYEITDIKEKGTTCESMKGFIEEAHTMMSGAEEGPVRDIGVVAYGKKIGHYLIGSYETLVSLAEGLGHQDAAQQLKMNLAESRDAESEICSLGKKEIGPDAVRLAA